MIDVIWTYVVPFLLALTPLVFVHELGHFLVARWNGVKVEVFSIGFGPELFGWNDKTGTRWKFSAFPLGGYVKMFGEYDVEGGEDDPGPMTEEQQKISFHHKRLGQRAAIVSAGPIANFLFAIVLFGAIFLVVGNPVHRAAVGTIQDGSAAQEAGFATGDRILSIDGTEVTWFEDLRGIVMQSAGRALEFTVLRDGTETSLTATPKAHDTGDGVMVGLLGVSPDPEQMGYVPVAPLDAATMAVEQCWSLVTRILDYLGQIISGSRGTEELGGPLRIAQISGQVAQGDMVDFIFFVAALSVNLGLINLFPIPMLDGGHLAFYVVEGVLRRPVDERIQEYGFRFGLILVLLLMVFATWNDLVHMKVFEVIKDFVS